MILIIYCIIYNCIYLCSLQLIQLTLFGYLHCDVLLVWGPRPTSVHKGVCMTNQRVILLCHLTDRDRKQNWKVFRNFCSGKLHLISQNAVRSGVLSSTLMFCSVYGGSAAWRIVRGCPRGCGGFEKVGILERKQMAHIKSKGPL